MIGALLYYAPAIIAPRVAALGVVLLVSHRLAPDQFGYFTLALLVGEMLEVTASNWIRIALLRLDSARPAGWSMAIRRSAALTALCTILALIGAGIAAAILTPGAWLGFTAATGSYIVTNAVLRLGLTALQLQDRRRLYAAIEGLRAVAMITAVWSLIEAGEQAYAPLVWVGSAITGLAALFALAVCGYRPVGERRDRADLIDRFAFGVPVIVLTLLAYAVTSTDRLALQLLLGPAQVGVYAAAYALARQPLDVLATALNQGAFPELVRRYEGDGDEAAGRLSASLLGAYILLLGSGAIALSVLARPFAAMLLPEAYVAPAATVMPLIAAAAVVLNIKNFVFDNLFHLKRRNWLQCLSFLPGAAVVVVTSVMLVPRLGGLGAAIAMLSGAAAGLVGSALLSARLIRLRINGREIVKAAIGAAATGGGAWLGAHWVSAGPVAQLAAGAAAGLLVGCAALTVLRPKAVADFI